MKRSMLLFFACAFTLFAAQAQQTDRGRVLAGGVFNMNFGTSQTTTNYTNNAPALKSAVSNNFRLDFTPNIGFFMFKNLALGIKMKGELSNSKADTITLRNSNLSASLFGRYYYKIGNFAPFLELSYGRGNIAVSGTHITKTKNIGNIIGVGPGIAFFVSDKIGIEGILNYEHLSSKIDINQNNISNKLSRGNTILFNIGLQVYL